MSNLINQNYDAPLQFYISYVSQIYKPNSGLVMVSAVLQGDYLMNFAESQTADEVLKRSLKEHQIKGFSSVLISKNVEEGLCSLIQTSGLGVFTTWSFFRLSCSKSTDYSILKGNKNALGMLTN